MNKTSVTPVIATIGIVAGILLLTTVGVVDLIAKDHSFQLFPLTFFIVMVVGIIAFLTFMTNFKDAFVKITLFFTGVALLIVFSTIGKAFDAQIAKSNADQAQANVQQAQVELEKAKVGRENLQKWQFLVETVKSVLKPDPPPELKETYEMERKFRLGWDWGMVQFWGEYGIGVFAYACTLLAISAMKKRGWAVVIFPETVLAALGGYFVFIALYPSLSQQDAGTSATANLFFWICAALSAIYAFLLAQIKQAKKHGEEELEHRPVARTLFKTLFFPVAGGIGLVVGADFLLNLLGNELIWTTQLTAQTVQVLRVQGTITGLLLPKLIEQLWGWGKILRLKVKNFSRLRLKKV